ncbi:hypothetical protein BN1708_010657 [Verticillium longisporum]|uniref:Uncharacterized protein n=1 Tax=Verticillium longisporum TaxID=100787 RepID=A0A0G4KSV7_VERLO|nr:hypothetical protein BN1708_010657 [Verticillium longisporum]
MRTASAVRSVRLGRGSDSLMPDSVVEMRFSSRSLAADGTLSSRPRAGAHRFSSAIEMDEEEEDGGGITTEGAPAFSPGVESSGGDIWTLPLPLRFLRRRGQRESDFFRIHSRSPIVDARLVTIDDPQPLLGHGEHELHEPLLNGPLDVPILLTHARRRTPVSAAGTATAGIIHYLAVLPAATTLLPPQQLGAADAAEPESRLICRGRELVAAVE